MSTKIIDGDSTEGKRLLEDLEINAMRVKTFFRSENGKFDTLQRMKTYGGSFVKQLAPLFEVADPNNQMKLIATFYDYFVEYRDWGKGGGDNENNE